MIKGWNIQRVYFDINHQNEKLLASIFNYNYTANLQYFVCTFKKETSMFVPLVQPDRLATANKNVRIIS